MQLSPNFTLAELIISGHDVDNTPNADQIKKLTILCNKILEPVRAFFDSPVIITSGFRSGQLNKLVGGQPTSQHTKAEAADFHVKGVANAEVYKYIVGNLIFDQVIAEKLSKQDGAAGWVHCSYTIDGPNRKNSISFLGAGKYVPGLEFIS